MKRRGFTLVEMVIALTLFALVAGTIAWSFGGYWRGWRKLTRQMALFQTRNLTAERITTDLRAADGIVPTSTSAEAVVQLGVDTIVYSYQAGKVRRQKNGSAAYLTAEGEIGRLIFSYPFDKAVAIQLDDLSWLVTLR